MSSRAREGLETVSRTFAQLKRRGLLREVGRHGAEVLDEKGLRALAAG